MAALHASRRRLVAVLGILVCAACAKPDEADSTATAADRQGALEAATAAFHQALRTNDSTQLLAFVDENVTMMPPGEAPVHGEQAMRDWYARFLGQYRTTSLALTDREVFVGEGWGVEMGAFEWGLTPARGGAPVIDRGHYMQLWKMLPDGQWRFAREIWNSGAPSAPPPRGRDARK